jgi:outer membrane protein insertion porin family
MILLVGLFCSAVHAQLGSELLPSYEGQNVSSVEVAGRPDLSQSIIEPLLAQKAGEPLSREKIDQTIKNLESFSQGPNASIKNVQLRILPEANGIRLVFVLEPGIYIGMYEFPGAERFSYSRLLQVTNYQSQQPYSATDIQSAQSELQTFLRQTGFFLAQVNTSIETHPAYEIANVNFNVTLNRRAHIGKIIITGTSPEETQRLKGALGSIMARLHSSSLKPGQTYTLSKLNSATNYLQRQLAGQNFLAAKVKLISASYDPETNHADITFSVTTGPAIKIKTTGAHLWSWTRKSLLPMYDEHQANQELIQEGKRNLLSHFQSQGYFNVEVNTNVERQANKVTIVYQITKGKRHRVSDVKVVGNKKVDEDELMPKIMVQKARFFFEHGKYSQQLVASSVTNLTDFYHAAGYANAKVTPRVTHTDDNIVATFYVDEGPLDTVEALNIVGNNSLPESQFASNGLNLGPGKPYSQSLIRADRNHILARYLSLGYLTANFRATAKPSNEDPHRLIVTYSIYEGPRVEASTVVKLGLKQTRPSLIDHTVGIDSGDPVSANEMLISEGKLYRLGIFDWAAINPRRPITTQSQSEVLVQVHESKRNIITYGFGFEVINRGGSVPSGTVAVPGLPPVGLPSTFTTSEKTFYGPRGSFAYTRNNMRGRAETFTISALGARLEQRAAATYSIPSFRNTKWSLSGTGSYGHDSTNPIYTARIGDVGLQLQRTLRGRANTLILHYDFRRTSITNLLIPDLVPPSDRFVRLSLFGTTFIHDTRDNPIDAHHGTYDSYEMSVNPSTLGSNFSFTRFLGQTAYYKPLPHNIVWANSIRLGLEQPFSGSTVPLSEEFFSGGGSTLRGFPLNGAGPQQTIPACGNPSDPSTCTNITVPVGGNQLLILNTELRFPLFIMKNLGAAVFYDGGNVFSKIGFHDFWGNYTNSVGGGLRYHTPVGPVRIDIGHLVSPIPGIKATQIFITLGQAF